MFNYSNTIAIVYGDKEKLKAFAQSAFVEEITLNKTSYPRWYSQFSSVEDDEGSSFCKPIEYLGSSALLFGGVFKNHSPYEEIIKLAKEKKLKAIVADCFQGDKAVTIYKSGQKKYPHDVRYYFKNPQKIDEVRPLGILNDYELIFGAVTLQKKDIFEEPFFQKMLQKRGAREKFEKWSQKLTDIANANEPQSFEGSPIMGLFDFTNPVNEQKIKGIIQQAVPLFESQELKKAVKLENQKKKSFKLL